MQRSQTCAATTLSPASLNPTGTQPMTPVYALTNALYLALTAPSDAQAQRAKMLADHFASDLNVVEIDAAKERALIMWADGQ